MTIAQRIYTLQVMADTIVADLNELYTDEMLLVSQQQHILQAHQAALVCALQLTELQKIETQLLTQ